VLTKIKLILSSSLRVFLTRLTTAFMMFYVALSFDVESLAIAAIFILFFNLSELVLENGIFETYINKYNRKLRLTFDAMTAHIFYLISAVIIAGVFISEHYFFLWLVPILFLSSINIPFIQYLKYRQKLFLITKLYFKANLSMLAFFIFIQLYIQDFNVIILSLLVQQIVLFFCINKNYNVIISKAKYFSTLSSFDMQAFGSAFTYFYFKFATFINSRFIEIYIIVVFSKTYLSSFVAGSRVYNIICLFLFTIINEVFLKKLKNSLGSFRHDEEMVNFIRFIGFIICPIFIFIYFKASFLLDFIFKDKFYYSTEILRFFSLFGIFQTLYLFIYQISLLYISKRVSLIYNTFYIITMLMCFSFTYFSNSSFIDLIKIYVFSQCLVISAYSCYFLMAEKKFRALFGFLYALTFNLLAILFFNFWSDLWD